MAAYGPAFLIVQVDSDLQDIEALTSALHNHPAAQRYLFHVVVSEDVPLDDPIMLLWGWFTRFDPAADLYPAKRRIQGNRLILEFPIAIDARWKKGYPRPVAFDPEVARRVERDWDSYGIRLD